MKSIIEIGSSLPDGLRGAGTENMNIGEKIKKTIPMYLVLMPTNPVGTGTPVTLNRVYGWVVYIAQFLIVVSAIIAVIAVIWGGITYMMAGGDEKKASEARTKIKNGIIGALVIFGIGVIMATVMQFVTTLNL